MKLFLKKITFVALNIFVAALLLIIIEFTIRLLYPEIKISGTQSSLIKEHVYYSSQGLVPYASGYSGDVLRYVNHMGFWKYSRKFDKNKPAWLICGDSVTMGIDCKSDSTFAGIINNSVDSINILNSSLIGYSSADYLNITKKLLKEYNNPLQIKKIMIFWCLNDIYSNFPNYNTPGFHDNNLFDKLIILIRSNSKLYQFLKNIFTDRPKRYYLYDKAFYDENNKRFIMAIKDIKEISNLAVVNKIKFYLFILPYEYQIRNFNEKETFLPQNILVKHLNSAKIKVIDCSEAFSPYQKNSNRLYLYGDGIHFSNYGHRILAKYLLTKIRDLQ